MRRLVGTILMTSMVCTATNPSYAEDPWFTGPLLAPAGVTIPYGHFNFEPYVFYTENIGMYNRHGKLIHTLSSQTMQLNPVISYGLSDSMDFQFSLPYAINHSHGITGEHIGDAAAILGYQVFRQGNSRWRPNLRLTLQQLFPTGRFEELSPFSQGTDGTGMGSYQTSLMFNFQHQLSLWGDHYLCSLLSLNYTWATTVGISGMSTYGGTSTTNGRINPGNLASIDVAGEVNITQHWAAVMEAYYFKRQGTRFKGNPGMNLDGTPAMLGSPPSSELSLAPAVEFNFSANYGIIAGVWFAVKGKDIPDFISTVVAFNAYW